MLIRRPALLITVSSLTLILTCLGLLLALRLRTGPLVERLSRDARVFEPESFPRPSHVMPATPGTVAQALEPLRKDISEAYLLGHFYNSDEVDPCLPIITGQQPIAALPDECMQALDAGRSLVRRVLAATRAEHGGMPGLVRKPVVGYMFFHPLQGLPSAMPVGRELLILARLAALEIRFLVSQGQSAEAVDLCLDTLALGRDMTLGSGVDARNVSSQVQTLAYRPCAAALAAASVERQRLAVEQLERLRQGWPSLADTVRVESVACQLYMYGGLLSPQQLGLLPPTAQALADRPSFRWDDNVASRMVAREMWRLSSDWFEAMKEAAAQPPATLAKAFGDVDARFQSQKGLGVAPPTVAPYLSLVRQSELQKLQLDALLGLVQVHLARSEQGRWPQALPPSASERLTLSVNPEGHVMLAPRDATFAEQALELDTKAGR
jgi:hypothetical protein